MTQIRKPPKFKQDELELRIDPESPNIYMAFDKTRPENDKPVGILVRDGIQRDVFFITSIDAFQQERGIGSFLLKHACEIAIKQKLPMGLVLENQRISGISRSILNPDLEVPYTPYKIPLGYVRKPMDFYQQFFQRHFGVKPEKFLEFKVGGGTMGECICIPAEFLQLK